LDSRSGVPSLAGGDQAPGRAEPSTRTGPGKFKQHAPWGEQAADGEVIDCPTAAAQDLITAQRNVGIGSHLKQRSQKSRGARGQHNRQREAEKGSISTRKDRTPNHHKTELKTENLCCKQLREAVAATQPSHGDPGFCYGCCPSLNCW
jgi:hypothetical protein